MNYYVCQYDASDEFPTILSRRTNDARDVQRQFMTFQCLSWEYVAFDDRIDANRVACAIKAGMHVAFDNIHVRSFDNLRGIFPKMFTKAGELIQG